MTHIINGTYLTLANGYSLAFEYPIRDTREIDGVIIVVLDVPAKVVYKQNVFAITVSGDYLWRIGKVKLHGPDSDHCSYIGSTVNQDGELVLFNWCDTAVVVDPYTGDVIRLFQTK